MPVSYKISLFRAGGVSVRLDLISLSTALLWVPASASVTNERISALYIRNVCFAHNRLKGAFDRPPACFGTTWAVFQAAYGSEKLNLFTRSEQIYKGINEMGESQKERRQIPQAQGSLAEF